MIHRIHAKAFTAAAAVVALAAMMTAGLHAQSEGPRRRPHAVGGGFPMLRQLDLTETQREQVREVRQRYDSQMREAGKRLREAHQAQRAAVETVPVNEGLIRSTSQALANAQTDMALLQARIHSDVWSLLTPEQQERAKQLKTERANRMQRRLQRTPPRPRG